MGKRFNGMVIWQGPSLVDGKPIAVIVTGLNKPSQNSKTGDMLQSWIIRTDMDPCTAVDLGEDESICGTCIHRKRIHDDGKHHRTCYVTLIHGPLGVYKAFTRGIYPHMDDVSDSVLDSMRLPHWDSQRIGSYGDPTAAPFEAWTNAKRRLKPRRHTGYSHRWRECDQRFKELCMASADTVHDVAEANALGWRTFLVLPDSVPPMHGTIQCPSDPSRTGVHVPCESCGQCAGSNGKHKRNIWIRPHGMSKHFVTLPTL